MFFFYKFKPRNRVAEKVRLSKKIVELNFENFIFCDNCFNINCLYFVMSESLIYRKLDKYFKYICRNVACEILSWKTIDVTCFFVRNNIKNVEAEKNRFLYCFTEL